LLLTLLLVGTTVATDARAATAPDTRIFNRAEIAYFDVESGTVIRTQSNASNVVVGRVLRFELDGPGDTIAHAAKFLSLAYRIRNTGNVADSYQLSVADLIDDAGEIEDLVIYHDLNGNGVADPGEPIITETLSVEPGALFELVVAGSVPNTALEDTTYDIELTATGAVSTLAETSTITIIDGAFISIDKLSKSDCSTGIPPDSNIDYRIDFTNSGNRVPESRTFVIDGQPRSGVLLVDKIPIGTELVPEQNLKYAPLQATTQVGLGYVL